MPVPKKQKYLLDLNPVSIKARCSVNLFKLNLTNRIGNTLPLNPEILCLKKSVLERLHLYLDELEITRLYLGLESSLLFLCLRRLSLSVCRIASQLVK